MKNLQTTNPARYDLLPCISEFLDLHMIFPLIQFAESLPSVYNPQDLRQSRLELAEFTHLEQTGMDASAAKKDAVAQELKALTESCLPLLSIFNDASLVGELKANKRLSIGFLESSYKISSETLESFFLLGKFYYECGRYVDAKALLSFYRELTLTSLEEAFQERSFDALWGKLACEIMLKEDALADVRELTRLLDAKDVNQLRPVNHLEQLQFRRWLLHWSLFVLMPSPEGRSSLLDLFLGSNKGEFLRNRNVLENHCPWLLRYAVACHLANSSKLRRPSQTRDLVLLVEQETAFYSDPVLELFLLLFHRFDKDRAAELLVVCETQVFAVDFFLQECKADFFANVRLLLLDLNLKLNSTCRMSDLCQQLSVSEEWLVESAKSLKHVVVVAETHELKVSDAPSQALVWQSFRRDRVQDLKSRTAVLESSIATMQQEGTMQ